MALNIESSKMKCDIQCTTRTYAIQLAVENISKLPCGRKLCSPDFYLAPKCTCNIHFEKSESDLFVCIHNKSETIIEIERTIALLDCDNNKLHEQNEKDAFSIENNEEKDMIGIVSNRKRYDTLPNDMLLINLTISMKENLPDNRLDSLLFDTDPITKLRKDFKAMLENPVNSDVTLQVGDERIMAHWSILCSRCPYFKNMFYSEMLERVQNTITISDLSLYAVKRLIQFLYTGDIGEKVELQELFDLYYAADKYEVMDLRTLCANKIRNSATPNNLCQILQFAHSHNDNKFKRKIMGLMAMNAEAVFQTDDWEKFKASNPLAADIFNFCYGKN